MSISLDPQVKQEIQRLLGHLEYVYTDRVHLINDDDEAAVDDAVEIAEKYGLDFKNPWTPL